MTEVNLHEEIPRKNFSTVKDALAMYSHSGFICYGTTEYLNGKQVYSTLYGVMEYTMRLAEYRTEQNLDVFFCSWNSLRSSRGILRVRFFLSFNNCAGTKPPATPDDLDSTLAIICIIIIFVS